MSILNRAIALCETGADNYKVFLATGDYAEMRHVAGPDEIATLESSGAQFAESVKKGLARPDVLSMKVRDPLTLIQCHFVSKLYVASYRVLRDKNDAPIVGENAEIQYVKEDEDPSLVDWLNMAKRTPYAFRSLWMQVDEELTGRATVARREAVDAAKKG